MSLLPKSEREWIDLLNDKDAEIERLNRLVSDGLVAISNKDALITELADVLITELADALRSLSRGEDVESNLTDLDRRAREVSER